MVGNQYGNNGELTVHCGILLILGYDYEVGHSEDAALLHL